MACRNDIPHHGDCRRSIATARNICNFMRSISQNATYHKILHGFCFTHHSTECFWRRRVWHSRRSRSAIGLAERSPLTSYLIPSLFLFIVVGGICLFSSVSLFRNSSFSKKFALLSGVLLVLWIAIQVRIIGFVSWLQPAVFISGVIVIVLSHFLPEAEMK